MGKSRKRVPIVKTYGLGKIAKRQASKKARASVLTNGCQYKKVYDSYNICDHEENLYRSYHVDGKPKGRWIAELTPQRLREFWNK
jgi:hypothetical protein